MARNGRMRLLAAASAALIIISVLLLWTMPANPEETDDQAMTYFSIGIYVVGLTLTGPMIYYMRSGQAESREYDSPKDDLRAAEHGEPVGDGSDDYISDIEREFRALELEIEREEQG